MIYRALMAWNESYLYGLFMLILDLYPNACNFL